MLVYSIADTNLEPFMMTDVEEMGAVGSGQRERPIRAGRDDLPGGPAVVGHVIGSHPHVIGCHDAGRHNLRERGGGAHGEGGRPDGGGGVAGVGSGDGLRGALRNIPSQVADAPIDCEASVGSQP